ncbi:MAG: AMP-binding protein [Deltaproteobacteria bacterium]|nr:AMP-binding protein [Deltaproteobacteria bacterium]MBW2445140.1 AMP-binding protein [Deltaproteobacteria bacterium]
MSDPQPTPLVIPKFDAPLTLGAQIEARALHPDVGSRPYLRHDDRLWTYRQYRDESVRLAHFLLERLGTVDDAHPGHVAMIMENHMELLALYGACGYAGLTLFGVNTGLRGETLAGVLNQSRARLLVVDERLLPQVEAIRAQLEHIPEANILVVPTAGGTFDVEALPVAVDAVVQSEGAALDPPQVDVGPDTNLMVIYTSGTTGLPKGINNNHFKLLAIGMAVSGNLQLDPSAVGYACMPLFHSNALFLGVQPTFQVGGSIAIRERFSASRFVPDVLAQGVTYWNYVGEPVHYVLSAIEKEYGGDVARIRAEVAQHPDNHLAYAIGNGASPPDLDRFIDWLGLEDMFELYGSTEAAISTFRKLGDPRGSVGEVTDEAVQIVNEKGQPCPPAELDEDGKILNYAEAVGEICRVAPDTSLFQGYFDNADANDSKYRDGVYHSGDLGHILVRDGKRHLFFDGRTDDWIRKDGENFSAAQVGRLLQEDPNVDLAAAYGAPCVVSDELVMAALKLVPGAEFDPQAFFDFCEGRVRDGGMDRKWIPDYVRVVLDFEFTGTQKILVRNLKKDHFNRHRLPDEPIFRRTRGDTTFRPFSKDDYEALRADFVAAERDGQLDR